MKKILILMTSFIGLFVPLLNANAETVAVIVNAENNEEINIAHVRAIYSDFRFEWSNGNRIKLYELPVKTASREKFATNVLKKSAVESQTDWNNRKITNVINNRPYVKRDKLILKRVARDKNAIGYVPLSLIEGVQGVKVVLLIK